MLSGEVLIIQECFKWRVQVTACDVLADHRQGILAGQDRERFLSRA